MSRFAKPAGPSLLILTLLLFSAFEAPAEVVVLKNGRRLNASQIRVDGTQLVIELAQGGSLRIAQDAVRAIQMRDSISDSDSSLPEPRANTAVPVRSLPVLAATMGSSIESPLGAVTVAAPRAADGQNATE